jgi:phosphoserine phosphatase
MSNEPKTHAAVCTETYDLGKHLADLQAVLEVSRDLAATTELDVLLAKVEHAARGVLECERATVFLYDRERDELYSRIATGVDQIRFSASRGIAGEVIHTGEVINVPDAYADERFNPEIDRKTGYRTRNILSFPLLGFDNTAVGVLQVLNKNNGSFDPWDEELVRTFGAQVGVAVQRQMLLEQYAEKQRIQRDLNIARSIQQGYIPKEPAAVEGFDVAGWNKPADETGGDCFDYLKLPNGNLAITLADATGHGIGPALVIASCRAHFHAAISINEDLATVVPLINNLLNADLPGDRFVTAYFGVLSPATGTLSYVSAGHGPLLRYDAATDEITELPANGVPLGIVADFPFGPPDELQMKSGDMMILTTDGFFEWANAKAELFGSHRIIEIVKANRHLSSAEIIQRIYEAVLAFSGGTVQADDLTAVVIKKL